MATGTLKRRALTALSGDQRRGENAEDLYYERASTFDPYAAVNRSAEGAFRSMMPEVERGFRRLRGNEVAGSRFDTGFRETDEREFFDAAMDRLNSTIAANSMTAAGMDLSNLQGIGSYGQNVTGRYLDMLAGERDRETAEEQARRNRSAGLWGALAGAAGTVLGGPVGGVLAQKIFR
jgi:hypothetical protein